MSNLPDNTQVHDSDPAEQKYLAGRLVVSVGCSMSFGIIPSDHCEDTREAIEYMVNFLKAHLRQARIRLDFGDIEVRPIQFEPDRGENET